MAIIDSMMIKSERLDSRIEYMFRVYRFCWHNSFLNICGRYWNGIQLVMKLTDMGNVISLHNPYLSIWNFTLRMRKSWKNKVYVKKAQIDFWLGQKLVYSLVCTIQHLSYTLQTLNQSLYTHLKSCLLNS